MGRKLGRADPIHGPGHIPITRPMDEKMPGWVIPKPGIRSPG